MGSQFLKRIIKRLMWHITRFGRVGRVFGTVQNFNPEITKNYLIHILSSFTITAQLQHYAELTFCVG